MRFPTAEAGGEAKDSPGLLEWPPAESSPTRGDHAVTHPVTTRATTQCSTGCTAPIVPPEPPMRAMSLIRHAFVVIQATFIASNSTGPVSGTGQPESQKNIERLQ